MKIKSLSILFLFLLIGSLSLSSRDFNFNPDIAEINVELTWDAPGVPSWNSSYSNLFTLSFIGENDTTEVTFTIGSRPYGNFEPIPFLELEIMNPTDRRKQSYFEKDGFRLFDHGKIEAQITGSESAGLQFTLADKPSSAIKIPYPSGLKKMKVTEYGKCVLGIEIKEKLYPAPKYSMEEIDSIITIEKGKGASGYYTYLDRDNDTRLAQPGGFYKLALISDNDGGYEIIYLDGAEVNSALWKPGMLKGRLRPTIFKNNYDLEWLDSANLPIAREVFATLTDNVILELNFPIYKTKLRFSRVQ